MLDGLLNRGLSSKCKSIIKATRTRIEVVRRRAEAKQRFLKEDLAKLLGNGLDINAYGRTEEFLAGLNVLSCYDFIEYSCEYVVKQLSSMQKQRECPEECREVVASLMFAAARFSDFPELRDLRDLFQERYGSPLECFVNQKFVEKLSSKPPLMDKRLQLLKDIASEFSIKWDCKGFEQRMAAPTTLAQAQPYKHGPSSVGADEYNLLNANGSIAKSETYDVSPNEAHGLRNDGSIMHNGQDGKYSRREDGSVAKFDIYDISPIKRHGLRNDGHRMHNGRDGKDSRREEGSVAKTDSYDISPKKAHRLRNDAHRMHSGREGKDSRREEGSVTKSDMCEVSSKELSLNDDDQSMHNGREGKDSRREELNLLLYAREGRSTNGLMSPSKKGQSTSRRVHNVKILEGRQEVMVVDKHELSSKKDDTLFKAVKSATSPDRKRLDNFGSGIPSTHDGESREAKSHGKTKLSPSYREFPGKIEDVSSAHEHVSQKNLENSKRIVQEEVVDNLKSFQNTPRPPPYTKSNNNGTPPPYVKPKESKHRPSRKFEQEGSYCDGHSMDCSSRNRVNEMNGSNWNQREPDVGVGKVRSHGNQKEQNYQDDKIPLPKPRSIRRKHHKSSFNHDDEAHVEDSETVKRSSSSRRRGNSRKGSQTLFDDEHSRKDEEERMIDKLLLHYSKKPSTYDAGKLRKFCEAHPSHQISNDTIESSYDRRKYVHDLSPDTVPTTIRSISLPHEETMPSESKKVFTRANSFQPDSQARHVHPKLPDYDDLAARLAALKDQ